MIDFKIKGTKLPVIPEDTEYRCSGWENKENNRKLINNYNNFISYGTYSFENNLYILCDKEGYSRTNYFSVKESDIIKLAKEQGMIEDFVLPGKWCIRGILPPNSDNQVLNSYFNKFVNQWAISTPNRFYYIENLRVKRSNDEVIPKDYTEITFEQFKKYVLKTTEKLPEKYYVKLDTAEELMKVATAVNKRGEVYPRDFKFSHWSYVEVNPDLSEGWTQQSYNNSDFQEFTFKEWEKLYNKKENNMKEIIGYKLIKPEYEKAAAAIANYSEAGLTTFSTYMLTCNIKGNFVKRLKEAQVLDTWFEPVYKSMEEIISVGGKFNVTIRDGKIWHGSDDITEFVNKMIEEFEVDTFTFGKFNVTIDDIEFSKTGCQHEKTKLSDWKVVYEEYLNLK